jgi:chemotaxis signal transduction protein
MEFNDSFYLLTQFFDKFLALPLNNVLGVFKLESITPIPNNKNKYLLGVSNAKGNIVPVIDLKMGAGISDSDLLVVFQTKMGKNGAVFNRVEEVISLSKEDLENAKNVEGAFPYLLLVKNSKEIILLDLDKKFEIIKFGETFLTPLPKAS